MRMTLVLTLLSAATASAAPITVMLTGELGDNTPYGPPGSTYTLELDFDDDATPLDTSSSTSAKYLNQVIDFRFTSENTVLSGTPLSGDGNALLVSNNSVFPSPVGPKVRDIVFGQFWFERVGLFSDLRFAISLSDVHDLGEPDPTGVTELTLAAFRDLDINDFALSLGGTQVAGASLRINVSFQGQRFNDFNSTITSWAVTARSVPEPGSIVLIFSGIALLGLRKKQRR